MAIPKNMGELQRQLEWLKFDLEKSPNPRAGEVLQRITAKVMALEEVVSHQTMTIAVLIGMLTDKKVVSKSQALVLAEVVDPTGKRFSDEECLEWLLKKWKEVKDA